jgi:leucyl aminopeptidase
MARRGVHRVLFVPVCFQGISTGKHHAAVLTNSEAWEAACVRAGRSSGDLAHPLVYCPELHFSEFTSALADMKNSVAVRTPLNLVTALSTFSQALSIWTKAVQFCYLLEF